jgi:hypothetical protein
MQKTYRGFCCRSIVKNLESMNINNLVILFSIVSVLLRVVFWAYTGRIWEDALIAVSAAQNFWDGLGLTQHGGESPVDSFSSPLGLIVIAIGESFSHGVTFVRISSLVASVFSIYFASNIMRRCAVNKIGEIACLSYLSCDHLQIFLGMSGMETQLATTLALATIYFCLWENFVFFGLVSGFALLARPELALVDFVCFARLVRAAWFGKKFNVRNFFGIMQGLAVFVIIIGPWIMFTCLYYGSPIPQTILVKHISGGDPSFGLFVTHAVNFWRQVAPFREFFFVVDAPISDTVLKSIVVLITLLAGYGLVIAIDKKSDILVVAIPVVGFVLYLNYFHVNPYFMWYMPPYTGLFFLVIAFGLSEASKKAHHVALGTSIVICLAYAAHLPFTLVLDKIQQEKVEIAVREKVGETLNNLMGPNDTVFLEPLGYIGSAVRTHIVYDTPGLSSKIAFAANRKYGPWKMLQELNPNFLVFRRNDKKLTEETMPGLMDHYTEVYHLRGDTGDIISYRGLSYDVSGDTEFTIYRRNI